MSTLSRKKVVAIVLAVAVAFALAITLPLTLSSSALAGQSTGMAIKEMSIKGHLVIEKNGVVVVDKDNIIVQTGYTGTGYATSQPFNVIGVGTGSTGPVVSDVDLEGTQARETGTFVALTWDTWQITYTWGPGTLVITHTATGESEFTGFPIAITEAGVFNEYNIGLVGVMLCRQTFGTITVGVADTLTVAWLFTVVGEGEGEEVEVEVDTDGDGLSDAVEVCVFMTDPTKWDTDGDGISDGLEAAAAGFNAQVETLPNGWIRVKIFWSNYEMDIETSSSVLGTTFDSENKKLTIRVSGPEGTQGECNITLPKDLVSSGSDIQVYLDNSPIEFDLSQDETYYYIHAEYQHSLHELALDYSPTASPSPANGAGMQIWQWALIGIGAVLVIAIPTIFILRKRRA